MVSSYGNPTNMSGWKDYNFGFVKDNNFELMNAENISTSKCSIILTNPVEIPGRSSSQI